MDAACWMEAYWKAVADHDQDAAALAAFFAPDDGPPPQWRRDLGIGATIHSKP